MNQLLINKQRLLTQIILLVSFLIPAVVTVLLFTAKPELEHNINIRVLPAFHAILNSATAVLLVLAFYFIRKKNIAAHKTSMLFALLFSTIFLVSYVVYHSLAESTTYGGEGAIRYFYYFILLTHIVLAAVIVPLVLFSFLRALTGKYEAHKKIARWTLPLWLYVAITGVLVYLMISPYYV